MADLIAHLLRRVGFGYTPEEHAAYAAMGFEASVDALVNFEGTPDALPPPDPAAFATERNILPVQRWWVERMLRTSRPLEEKMTLFWHGHFATANYKVRSPDLMYRQNLLLRRHALGNFCDLLREITVDPAMLIWLDGTRNRRGAPNENYARELFELFALGIGNYSEADIKDAARALTGWVVQFDGAGNDRVNGRAVFNRNAFDPGRKTIFGQTGAYDAPGLIDLTVAQPAAGRFIATKLYTFFVGPNPNPALVEDLAAIFRAGYDIRAMVRRLLLSDDFRAEAAVRANIASPAEFVVGTLRRSGMVDPSANQLGAAVNALRRMGQNLFNPPTVKGWDGGAAWIDTHTMLERFNFANGFATNRAVKEVGVAALLRSVKASATTPDEVIDVLDRRLFDGEMPDRLRAPLHDYLVTWSEGPTVFTLDERTLDTKVRGAIRLALASQAYQRN